MRVLDIVAIRFIRGRGYSVLANIFSILLTTCAISCSKDPTPRLPMNSAYGRNTARIDVAPIVVGDARRGQRAREVYLELAQAIEALALVRGASEKKLASLAHQPELNEDAIRRQVALLQADTKTAFQHYVDLQLELRGLLTEGEFKHLGKFD